MKFSLLGECEEWVSLLGHLLQMHGMKIGALGEGGQ
jgi:hypothetical protein